MYEEEFNCTPQKCYQDNGMGDDEVGPGRLRCMFEWTEMHTGFWQGNVKDICHFETQIWMGG